jgi:hypothetical protein
VLPTAELDVDTSLERLMDFTLRSIAT